MSDIAASELTNEMLLNATGAEELKLMERQCSELTTNKNPSHEQVLLRQLIDIEIKKKRKSIRSSYEYQRRQGATGGAVQSHRTQASIVSSERDFDYAQENPKS